MTSGLRADFAISRVGFEKFKVGRSLVAERKF